MKMCFSNFSANWHFMAFEQFVMSNMVGKSQTDKHDFVCMLIMGGEL